MNPREYAVLSYLSEVRNGGSARGGAGMCAKLTRASPLALQRTPWPLGMDEPLEVRSPVKKTAQGGM
jgi:hypothetical protein